MGLYLTETVSKVALSLLRINVVAAYLVLHWQRDSHIHLLVSCGTLLIQKNIRHNLDCTKIGVCITVHGVHLPD